MRTKLQQMGFMDQEFDQYLQSVTNQHDGDDDDPEKGVKHIDHICIDELVEQLIMTRKDGQ
eukprot:CAMPEP_0116873268 /NCGR_PEP_ID=MMETSP0463-20121206/4292_1 /TAXON_ID=181622 /ORGANISM="Strombidinopsis sp, Strain SopsisLIS2011" /LENGTH=60 /DNA_ID=CAMNT_0004514867 /DNA_START=16 /DNA_END=198 /DNA_ORIENTATION=+